MTSREWCYWHIIRAFGPITPMQLWELLWGYAQYDKIRKILWDGPEDFKLLSPNDPGPTLMSMAAKGLLEHVNPPRQRGKVPLYMAI